MVWPVQLLPKRARVALRGVRNDLHALRRSLHEPRFKGGRKRTAGWQAPVPSGVAPIPPDPIQTSDEASVVVFALSGVELALEPGVSILEAGLGAGVDLLFSCTMGGCAACMLQVLEGSVDYEDRDAICLTDDEIADGLCLACVGRPRGRVVLEA